MTLMVSADAAVGVSIGPLKGLSAFGVALDGASNLAGKVRFGSEDAAGNQIALNFGEPDFDLIEPGRVSRGVVELHLRVRSKDLGDSLGLVRRKVVRDDVDLFACGL